MTHHILGLLIKHSDVKPTKGYPIVSRSADLAALGRQYDFSTYLTMVSKFKKVYSEKLTLPLF